MLRTEAGSVFVICNEASARLSDLDVFTRKDYRDIVLDSLRHCQNEKGLLLHAWCIMSNHLHMIVSGKEGSLSDILCDFKKFTSK